MLSGDDSFRLIALLSLTLHTSAASLITHISRDASRGGSYSIATSILLGEVCKLIISIALACEDPKHLLPEHNEDTTRHGYYSKARTYLYNWTKTFKKTMLEKDAWKLSIPAGLYVLQNMLQLTAISHVSPMAYQALSQLKILAVAILSRLILGKNVSKHQWSCIALLIIGVYVVQSQDLLLVDRASALKSSSYVNDSWRRREMHKLMQSITFGQQSLAAFSILVACFLGSLGGVYLEKRFKSEKSSLWASNAQLSFFSMGPAAFLLLQDCVRAHSYNIFRNFGLWALSTVLVRAVGGLIVALVLKHCDNILKSFATSASIILTLSLDSAFRGQLPTTSFVLGAVCVIVSSCGYSQKVESEKKVPLVYEKSVQPSTRIVFENK